MASGVVSHNKKSSKKRKCFVEDVCSLNVKKTTAHPVLVNFRTSRPPNCQLEGHLEREVFSDGARVGHKYKSHITITGTGGGDFVGENQLCGINNDKDAVMVGVLDKTTGKLRLVEMDRFYVTRRLDANAQAHMRRLGAHEDATPNNADVLFGTKKNVILHMEKQRQKERQSAEMLTGIEDASATITTEGVEKMGTALDYSYIVPKINENATRAKDVYSMESVVPDEVLELLIDKATELLESKEQPTGQVSSLFLMSLSSARLEVDENDRLRNTCAALYMEFLLKIIAGKLSDTEDLGKELLEHFKTTYSALRKFIPKHMRDLALAHVLVLAMLVNKCQVPQSIILNSVTVNKPRLMSFCRVLRLKTTKTNFSLQLPLPSANIVDYTRPQINKRSRK